jgi:hypothetical protein
MRTNMITTIIILVIAFVVLGYGIWATSGSQETIDARIAELTPPNERKEVNTAILTSKIVQEVEKLKVHGKRPVGASATLNRSNPFEGI